MIMRSSFLRPVGDAPRRRLRAASGKLAERRPREHAAGLRMQVAGEYSVTIRNNFYGKAGISLTVRPTRTKKTARFTGGSRG
ncbi:hypothetical protein, partial [Achromobacter dolens]|uniref:hypothetical protein n=1 Tax=Achromobacter dolens TaxID=1287738 RepID=UPI0031CF9246